MPMAIMALMACGEVDSAASDDGSALLLDGPARLQVDSLGPVDGPEAMDADGNIIDAVVWTVSNGEVARIEPRGVVAVSEGETRVTGNWQGHSVEWTLVVMPSITVHFGRSPSTVAVGSTLPLQIQAHLGDGNPVDPGPLGWASSNERVATVTDGRVTGVAPGVVYITANSAASEAMLELTVIP